MLKGLYFEDSAEVTLPPAIERMGVKIAPQKPLRIHHKRSLAQVPAFNLHTVSPANLLFIQKTPHQAGAQACLLRLMHHSALAPWSPGLVTSSEGWLTNECKQFAIPSILEHFYGSSSWLSRLLFNQLWAHRVEAQLNGTIGIAG